MDDLRLAELARVQGGVVLASQLLACGLTRSGIHHRVVTGRLFPVRRGCYTLDPRQDAAALRWSAVLSMGVDRASLSHWTAAQAHGLWDRPVSGVHLSVPGIGGRRTLGMVIHSPRRLDDRDVVLVDGLRTTSPGRTVLDIAAHAGDPLVLKLIREGEFRGLLPVGEMLRQATANPRHPGTPRIRRVDPATVEDALRQTVLEDELDRLISTLPVDGPVRQLRVRGVSGARYRFDFAWPALRLAAEADGRAAHERASSLDGDRRRDNYLAAVGWLTMRFTRTQVVRDAARCGQQIVATFLDRSRIFRSAA